METETGSKKCPFCAEDIQAAAIKCKHCGSSLVSSPVTQPQYAVPAVPPIAVAPKNNGLAVASMACAVVGLLLFGIILGTIAVILGIVATSQISSSNGTQGGQGMATAGIVVGAIDIVVFFVILSAIA